MKNYSEEEKKEMQENINDKIWAGGTLTEEEREFCETNEIPGT